MEREPLDSLEYESTYLELRPSREHVMTTPARIAVPSLPSESARAFPSTATATSSSPSTDLGSVRPPKAVDTLAPPSPSRVTRSPGWSSVRPLGLALTSAAIGYAVDTHPQSARTLLVILSGTVLYGWARMAWRAKGRQGPLGCIATRALDRLVTVLGTFFAVMLWARYLPRVSVAFSTTVALVLCGLGLAGGIVAATRNLRS